MSTDICSIIIPCTRKEYIDECINSVLEQELINLELEILIINDKPDDEELKIYLDKFLINENIQVINNEENIGLSATRNKGLNLSKGNYIYFLDDDDYLSNAYALESMYSLLFENNTSLVLSENYNKGEDIPSIKFDEYYRQLKRDNSIRPVSCKLFKKSYLIENNLFFIENSYAEEDYLIYSILLLNPEISIFNKEVYFYRNTPGSITKSREYMQNLKMISRKIAREFYDSDYDFRLKQLVYLNLTSHSLEKRSNIGFF